jgi:hypothetical protein
MVASPPGTLEHTIPALTEHLEDKGGVIGPEGHQITEADVSWLITPEIVATLVPVALAIFSGRLTVVLGALVFALTSVCILLAPANAPEIVAIGFYLGSLIIAVSGIVAREKARALQTEIDQLRQDVNSLLIAARRRFVKELNDERERIIAITGAPKDEKRSQMTTAAPFGHAKGEGAADCG